MIVKIVWTILPKSNQGFGTCSTRKRKKVPDATAKPDRQLLELAALGLLINQSINRTFVAGGAYMPYGSRPMGFGSWLMAKVPNVQALVRARPSLGPQGRAGLRSP